MVAIGYFAWRVTDSLDDYLPGGRTLSPGVTAFSAFVIVSLTTIGGFLAVSWTDFVQGRMMLFALVVVALVMLVELGGPFHAVHSLASLNPDYPRFLRGASIGGIASLLARRLGYFGQPHILVRQRHLERGEAPSRVKSRDVSAGISPLRPSGSSRDDLQRRLERSEAPSRVESRDLSAWISPRVRCAHLVDTTDHGRRR